MSRTANARSARSARRTLRALLGAPLAALLAALLVAAGCGPAPPRPNIVLISLDTLRADRLGVYGYDRGTSPNLDRLARRGVVFRNHYAQAGSTAPSHTSILTGLFPSVADVWEHGEVLDPEVPMLAEIFKAGGYDTAAFVQLSGESYQRGFDIYTGLSHDASLRRRAAGTFEDVYDFVSTPRDEPFFLFLHTYSVHLPYNPPPEEAERFWGDYDGNLGRNISREDVDRVNGGAEGITAADARHVSDMYDAGVATLDGDLGAMFERFDAQGLFDNTVFAIIGDHGEEFGEHGIVGHHAHTLNEELLRTPLIMFGPGVPQGAEVQLPSRNVDVAPTLLSIARLDVPPGMQGFDLEPLWNGTETEPRVVVAERQRYRVFIVDGFKYDTGSGKLFDLRTDPWGTIDLRDERPDKVIELERIVAGWEAQLALARANVAEAGEVRLTPEEIRRLKALGYLR
jgi:arylsulfatase A-like enzyme